MKVVILCGGLGTRLREETEIKPKPMVEVGNMPILWHIMKTYAHYGFNDFVLCLGYKSQVIKDYFFNYEIMSNDFTIELGTKNVTVYPKHSEHGWKVTLVDTGNNAMTGARVKRIERFIDTDNFMLTYGDGLIDLNISELLDFHLSHGKIGTLTGVFPPSRYGELLIHEDHVVSFREKPLKYDNSINGGYFVFKKEFFEWLEDHVEELMQRDPKALTYAIARSCQDKADIVAADEKEQGQRALLNLGHTFGHAIETGLGYGKWLHGEAVACGMVMAAELSMKQGWIDESAVDRIRNILSRAKLPITPPDDLSPERFMELMSVDKKVLDGKLRLALIKSIGQSVITSEFDPENLRQVLNRS